MRGFYWNKEFRRSEIQFRFNPLTTWALGLHIHVPRSEHTIILFIIRFEFISIDIEYFVIKKKEQQ